MKMTGFILIALGAMTSPSFACGVFGWDPLGACAIAEDALKATEQITKQIRQTQEYVVRNTPGLSETAALNDLASPDPEVRRAAATRYRNLLAAAQALDNRDDTIPKYVLSVSYRFDEHRPFHIDKVRSADGSQVTAKLWYDQGSVELSDQTRPTAMNMIPLSEPLVRQKLLEKAGDLAQELTGNETVGRHYCNPTTPGYACPTYSQAAESLLADIPVAPFAPHANADALEVRKRRIEAFKQKLVDVVLSAYTYDEDRRSAVDRRTAWPISDGGDTHVIFFVDEDTWNAQSDFNIEFAVESERDPKTTWNNRPVRTLVKNQFSPLKGNNGKTFYWAQAEMSGASLTPDGLGDVFKRRMETLIALNHTVYPSGR
jgi:hypothetical protein